MLDPRAFLMSHAAPGLPAADAAFLAGALLRRCTAPLDDIRRVIGLDDAEVETLVATCFPGLAAGWHPGTCVARHVCDRCGAEPVCHGVAPTADYGRFSASLLLGEESDLRALFLSHRSSEGPVGLWTAAIIARACLEPDHLWLSIGLAHRSELTGALERHFRPLKDKNVHDMRWKKFFYKQLCDIEKVWTCTSSACEVCPHHAECYAPEE